MPKITLLLTPCKFCLFWCPIAAHLRVRVISHTLSLSQLSVYTIPSSDIFPLQPSLSSTYISLSPRTLFSYSLFPPFTFLINVCKSCLHSLAFAVFSSSVFSPLYPDTPTATVPTVSLCFNLLSAFSIALVTEHFIPASSYFSCLTNLSICCVSDGHEQTGPRNFEFLHCRSYW